ncbi:MAG TPA: hypothetical protein DHM37_06395 [Candidatus Cloacimonas sp.]|nr:hypothetical protein [Candidatus Cloacimonas sp.]
MNEENITDVAVVKQVNGDKIVLEIEQTDSCNSCAMHGICQAGDKRIVYKIKTDLKLQTGDRVKIFLEPGLRVLSSFLIFIFPILIMVLFYLGSKLIFSASENIAILFSILSLLFSGFAIYKLDKKMANRLKFKIVEKL